ncbi:MAG: ATP-binding protein [Pseudomonadota bacterium]
MSRIAFKTRARTIDHLGREQIADCPTAISELWKNAYDAYARSVALHIFDGPIPVAAVFDNGHGMSREEFEERWLVVGTESKSGDVQVPPEDRCGIAEERVRQGQKGIGRLSVAFLGPAVLVVSKRKGKPFVAALVDWRVFTNPFLHLEDVGVSVETFEERAEFPAVMDHLLEGLVANIWGEVDDPAGRERLQAAWARFDELERSQGADKTTSAQIADTALLAHIEERHLGSWDVWRGEREHGTALFVLGLHRELKVWVDPQASDDDVEVREVKDRLRFTLTGFVDPYREVPLPFGYRVVVHTDTAAREIVSSEHRFGLDNLRGLEHVLEGSFDEQGVFRGTVRAFGQERPPFVFNSERSLSLHEGGRVGPFHVRLGTFEQERASTTHTPQELQMLERYTGVFSGLAVYRDGLRVQPYGRPEADFFGMEVRRSQHAGREFWSHRRVFGRVAIGREENPKLRDKAGREGLIDNQALREMRLLVVGLLRFTARKFFGFESEIRQTELPAITARNRRALAAEKSIRRRTKKALREALKDQAPRLTEWLGRLPPLEARIARAVAHEDRSALADLAEEVELARQARRELALPPKPKKLDELEDRYREYRDSLRELATRLDSLDAAWNQAEAALGPTDPAAMLRSALGRHQQAMSKALAGWETAAMQALDGEKARLANRLQEDRGRYWRDASHLLTPTEGGDHLPALDDLLRIREELQQELADYYQPYLRAIEQLSEGVDFDSYARWSAEAREALEEKIQQIHALAQVGVTMEFVAHELDDLDSQVSRNLDLLPPAVRKEEPFRLAWSAHRALSSQLRFLDPLSLAQGREREDITGRQLYIFLKRFFRPRLEHMGVSLEAGESFLSLQVRDFRHRIFPVFTNMVHNSLYWLGKVEDRRILLDRVGDDIVVADSGPGVDPDDEEEIFEIFVSRRVGGRGIGLYLCRVNLAAGGHTIAYTTEPQHRLLPGANFVIRFRGIKDVQ